MGFFRKFFRGDQDDHPRQTAPLNAQEESEPRPEAPLVPPDSSAAAPASTPAPGEGLATDAVPADSADAQPEPWWASAAQTPPNPDPTALADLPSSANDTVALSTPPSPDEETPTPTEQPEEAAALTEEAPRDDAQTEAEPSEAAEAMHAQEGTRQLDPQSAPKLTSYRTQQGLAATAMRDIGRIRKMNQDSVFALLTTLPRESSDLPIGLFVVADGMGGHDGGEIASRLAIRTVVQQVFAELVLPALDDSMSVALQSLMMTAVEEANAAIWHHAQAIGSDMGTTCTAVLLLGHSLYIGHVGDSRAYLLEDGKLRPLTNDHSAVGRLIQLGQLDPMEAREHPLRNQLYRTVGQLPEVQVDFIYQSLGQATHILLCSDGLWGMVSEELMQQALVNHTWPQDVCHELIALANLAGGEDNISAIVVTLPVAERHP